MKANLLVAGLLAVAATPPGAATSRSRPGRVQLGTVTDKRGNVVYQVFTRFYPTQVAQGQRGHSELRFLKPTGQVVATYTVGRPADLPVALRRNVLYFRASTAGAAPHRQAIDPARQLPRQLCVAPTDCYHQN